MNPKQEERLIKACEGIAKSLDLLARVEKARLNRDYPRREPVDAEVYSKDEEEREDAKKEGERISSGRFEKYFVSQGIPVPAKQEE